MSIQDRLVAFRSLWQNDYVERPIDLIRWEYLDYMVVFGEAHGAGSLTPMLPIIMSRGRINL